MGLFDRIEILALEIFNQGHFKCELFGHVPKNHRHLMETGSLRCTPATFAGN